MRARSCNDLAAIDVFGSVVRPTVLDTANKFSPNTIIYGGTVGSPATSGALL